MRNRTIAMHLCVPVALSVGVFVVALSRESFEIGMLSAYLVGGLLFYAAPYLLWLVVMVIGGFSNAISHSGFIACSVALVIISSFWLFPGDPSGLPMQWMLYWPLAAILMIVIPVVTALYRRSQSPNNQLNTDSGADAPPPVN